MSTNDTESTRQDEEDVSKTSAGQKPVGRSSRPGSASKNTEPVVHQYRLNLYTHNGLLRSEIPRSVFTDMSRRYGDIIRAIPPTWSTMEDIFSKYQSLERRFRFELNRTNANIESAVEELAGSGIVEKK